MDKWTHIQSLANHKDDQLNENRQQWKKFKRHLEEVEALAEQLTSSDQLC